MRTPLTVIDGYVEAMIDGVMPATPATLAEVSEEVRRLRRLSEDLSTLSRAEEGRVELDLRPIGPAHGRDGTPRSGCGRRPRISA